jgi:hypothetical protein
MPTQPQPATPTAPTVPLPTTTASRPGSAGNGGSAPAPPEPGGCRFLALIVPPDEGEREAQAMENWLQACSFEEPFSLELVGTRSAQGFLLRASSERQLASLCKQFEAQYPQVQIQRVLPQADPLLLHPDEQAVIGEFSLAQPSYLPLKTFTGKALSEAGADPLAALLAAMETVGPGQRIIAQLALVRAKDSWLSADIRKSVEHALQPERDRMAAAMKPSAVASDVAEGGKIVALMLAGMGALLAYRWYQAHAIFLLILLGAALLLGLIAFIWWQVRHMQTPIYDMKLVAEKMARAGFYAQLRVIVIGKSAFTSQEQLQAPLSAMEVAYRQFTLASSNSLYRKRTRYLSADDPMARRLVNVISAFPYAHWLLRLVHGGAYSWQVLNALEIAGMFHLPQETADVPLVRRASLKGLLAEPLIARQIKATPAPLPPALMGYSQHRRYRVPVYLPFDALFSHKFFAGMSRSGKSVLIQLLTEAAMQPLREDTCGAMLQPGVFVADPHRDLIMDLLKLVPPSRMHDVLLLDMTDTQFPVALNPLDASMGFTRDQAVSNLMSCFQKIWEKQWGPRMAYFLNAICLLLYTLNEQLVAAGRAEEQYTLLDINPLLQSKDYAVEVLSQLNMSETWHRELMIFWQTNYFKLNPNFKNEIIMPIVSKIGVFNDNQQLRRIVGQSVTRAPVHQAITDGKIVLCALSARDMDDSAVNILGSTLINLLHHAFNLQQPVPLAQRRKVFVAVDEFQNFSGADFDKLLAEDAKYGCALLLATQSLKRLNQIRDGLLEMALSNCQQLCVFRISAADAKIMEEELQQKVTVKHIISQPGLHCYARLTLSGFPLQIVSAHLAHPASWQADPWRDRQVDEIRHENQARNLPVSEVDRRHAEHLHRILTAGKRRHEARAAKQEQEEADDLTEDLQAAQVVTGTKRSTGTAQNTPPGEAPDAQPEDQAQGKETAPANASKAGVTRNHRHGRSRHMGKKRVGMPPPEPAAVPADQASEDAPDDESFPLPGLGGPLASGGNSWGTSWGYEAGEGSERA